MTAEETEKKSTLREYYEALLIAIIFVNFARIFVFQAFKIPTGSMEETLLIGDHAGWQLGPINDMAHLAAGPQAPDVMSAPPDDAERP